MQRTTKVGSGCASGVLLTIGGMLFIPFLVVAGDGAGSIGCVPSVAVADDGTPSILGPPTLTATDLRRWWDSTERGQPPRLSLEIDDVIALYLSEGDAEGVRGDYAFAQAILETGYFTSTDTEINNFAGIAHHDDAASGTAYPDAETGVRAQIQLLKKFAVGNDVALAQPDVAPNAGASATTWGGLAGTWASSPQYWESLSRVYEAMPSGADAAAADAPVAARALCSSGPLAINGDYALPVERIWYEQHPEWFSKPHHDYPAADIPVPTGTPIYAAAAGVVVSTPVGGRCGIGVIINGDDGAQYTYCHGLPGSHQVATGDAVLVGQRLMLSASTGNSQGPHLHFAIRIAGEARCPQPLFEAVVNVRPITVSLLPDAGCSY